MLASLPKVDCETCLQDINIFYEIASEIVDRNRALLENAVKSAQGSKILAPGRVVVLRDSVSIAASLCLGER